MSRCRSRSFYVAPGERRYFDDHTIATRGPDGAWIEFTHRADIARYAAGHPDWDEVCWVGPPGGVDVLEVAVSQQPQDVEMWRLDERVVEGRRPADQASFALHRAAVGGVGRAGGARQLAVDAFPGAGRGVLAAAEGAARAGEVGRVWALSAVWRAGLLRDEMASELLSERSVAALAVMFDGLSPELAEAALGGLSAAERVAVLRDLVDPFAAETTWPLLARCSSDPEVLARLAYSEVSEVRAAVASNPATSLETLEHLARTDTLRRVLCAVAERAPDRRLLDLLAERGDLPLGAVLHSSECPPDLVAASARSADKATRIDAASHPNCPPDVLESLAEDPDDYTRTTAARRTSDPELLGRLANDGAQLVAVAAVSNSACPPATLEAALHGDNSVVRRAVVNNVACPPDLLWRFAEHMAPEDAEELIGSEMCPPDLVEHLVDRFDPDLTGRLSERASQQGGLTPALTARFMAQGQTAQWAIATNPHTDPAEVAAMLTGSDRVMACRAAHNDALPLGDAVTLLAGPVERGEQVALAASEELWDRSWGSSECDDPAEVARWASSPSEVLRAIAAVQVNCPADSLARLAQDPSPDVYLRAFENESTPPAALAKLMASHGDGDMMFSQHQIEATLVRLWDGGERQAVASLASTTKHSDAVLAAALTRPTMTLPAVSRVDRLFEAAAFRSANPEGPPERVRGVRDLPGAVDVPFGFADPGQAAAVDRASGVRVAVRDELEVSLRVIPTPRALSENANFMGNCTEGYRSSIFEGRKLILAADDPSGATVFNIELAAPARAGGPWMIGEVNSRFNAGGGAARPLVDRLVELGFVRSDWWEEF